MNVFVHWLSIEFWMQVIAAFLTRLLFLNRNTMSLCPCILTDPCHLPGHFHSWLPPCNPETIVMDFLGDIDLSIVSKAGQLIAKIGVECLKPGWKFDDRF